MENTSQNQTKGYHLKTIPKGIYGHSSKIIEECQEFEEALEQDCTLMALIELSDLLGAIVGYLELNHPSINILDLAKMSEVTKRAFQNKERI